MKWNIKSLFEISDKGAFMGIELVTDGLKNASGLVKYPNEFETVYHDKENNEQLTRYCPK